MPTEIWNRLFAQAAECVARGESIPEVIAGYQRHSGLNDRQAARLNRELSRYFNNLPSYR